VLDFKLGGYFAGTLRRNVGHGCQAGFGHKAADIFSVPLTHLSHAEHSDSELVHLSLFLDILLLVLT